MLATELCHRTCRLSEKWVDFHLVRSLKFSAVWHEQDPVRRRASSYAETLSLSTRHYKPARSPVLLPCDTHGVSLSLSALIAQVSFISLWVFFFLPLHF